MQYNYLSDTKRCPLAYVEYESELVMVCRYCNNNNTVVLSL